ncbi:hypothetical protein [Paenibacillus nuruki]|uniref:hypothetical protein n=1 Tax=Paenibacillus nuruki TaxID=1886670 RepID=UPI0028062C0B|nr:hypothetical protein [Paenibacillus nuruki]CAJ1317641.1 hypothetical protein AASFL403_20735 [Paenibacillus nuruki]
MRTSKERIAEFGQQHRAFPNLESLHAYRDLSKSNRSEYNIEVILCNTFVEGNSKMRITFLHARDINIGSLEGILTLMIKINDVSKDQMEDINYRIVEEENLTFSFYCKDFDFEMI